MIRLKNGYVKRIILPMKRGDNGYNYLKFWRGTVEETMRVAPAVTFSLWVLKMKLWPKLQAVPVANYTKAELEEAKGSRFI